MQQSNRVALFAKFLLDGQLCVKQTLLNFDSRVCQLQILFKRFQSRFTFFFEGEFSLDFIQFGVNQHEIIVFLTLQLQRALPIAFPLVQSQDAGKNALAVRGLLGGEGICFALQEKRGVYKSLVIQAQGARDAGIGFSHGALGQHLPVLASVLHHEVHLAAFAACQGTNDAISLSFVLKVENDFSAVAGVVNQALVAFTGFPIQGVSDAIEQ